MSDKFKVTVQDSFEYGYHEGFKSACKEILEMCEVKNVQAIKRYIEVRLNNYYRAINMGTENDSKTKIGHNDRSGNFRNESG